MKRLLIGAVILIGILGGLFIALPFLVSSDAVRNRIISHVEDLTGRDVSFSGNPSVSFNPFLGIKLHELTLSDPDNKSASPLVQIDQIQAKLNILPALIGEVRISNYHLHGLKINLLVDVSDTPNWKFNKGKLFDIINLAQDDNAKNSDADMGVFIIEDGIINYENLIENKSEQVTSINGQVSWENTKETFFIDTKAIWHGEEANINLEIENLPILLSGGESSTNLDFDASPLKLEFSGLANMISDLSFNGDLSFESPSIDRMLTYLDVKSRQFGGLQELKASGKLEAKHTTARLTEANVNLGGHEGTGSLSFTQNEGEETKIDGTLAFDELDFSQLIMGAKSKVEDGVSTPSLKDIKIDLRISANSVLAGDATLENVAAALTMEQKDWTLDIGNSESFGGNIILKFGERSDNDKRIVFFEMSAQEVDAAEISSLLGENKLQLSGNVTLNTNLKTSYLEDGFFTNNLNGTIKLSIAEGELENVDLQSIMNTEPNTQSEEPIHVELGGSTEFENLELELFINSGVASISFGKIVSQENDFRLHGYMNMITDGIAFSAHQYSDDEPQPITVFMGGTFRDPLVTMKHSDRKSGQ